MSYPVSTIAHYILDKCGEMSTMKLQKLVYYCQAWSLVWDDKPLIDEDFQAWVRGPVCPELYNLHKGKYSLNSKDISSAGDADNLDDNTIETINIVLGDYGKMDAFELSSVSHSEAPWQNARENLPSKERSENIIAKDKIKEFYENL